jgi:hypothetical protein
MQPPRHAQPLFVFGRLTMFLCCVIACSPSPLVRNANIATAAPSLTIMQIQGTQQTSAYVDQRVTTSGVVTLFSKDQQQFWLQDPLGDNKQETADGIFVDARQYLQHAQRPAVGDFIVVTAVVNERQFYPGLPLTMLTALSELKISRSPQPLPTALMLEQLPAVSIPAAIQFWQQREGMRVTVEDATVVAPTNQFGEFVILTRASTQAGSGYEPASQHLLLRDLGNSQVDYNPERILIDTSAQPKAILVRPPDHIHALHGVVHYSHGNYKIVAEKIEVEQQPLPAGPLHPAVNIQHNLSMASFNLENFFAAKDSLESKQAFDRKLKKLAQAIQNELQLPAIIVVQEVENTEVLQTLAKRINQHAGSRYAAVSHAVSDRRGIATGFLWDSNKVSLLNTGQLHTPQTEAAFGPRSASPGREPLLGRFRFLDQELLVIGNHFKSKRGDDPLFGIHQPAHRPTEVQRKAQAQAVRAYVNALLSVDPNALILLSGDFNDFAFAEPGEGQDHPLAILRGTAAEIPFTAVAESIPAAERFSYIHQGNAQLLDHMLLSPALQTHFRAAQLLHINASFPSALAADPTTYLRCSDHDPLISYFQF